MKKKINMSTEIHKIENEKQEKINETKCWFYEQNNKIDKTLSRVTKKKREKTQITEL